MGNDYLSVKIRRKKEDRGWRRFLSSFFPPPSSFLLLCGSKNMQWFLTFHIIGLILWLGGLLDLTRILGYHVKEDIPVQKRLSRMEFRMYWFVATPGMILAVVMGLFMFFKGGGISAYFGDFSWFRFKFALALVLIVVHFAFGKMVMDQRANPRITSPVRFKILHGVTGLIFISIVILAVVKPF